MKNTRSAEPRTIEVTSLSQWGRSRFSNRPKARPVPLAVLEQSRLCKKFNYRYKVLPNGNVENNSTLYVTTRVAHPYQVEGLFNDAIDRAKGLPNIFGTDFECSVKVNLVRNHKGEYLGYAFVDVTNPKFYYVMLGMNPDGTDRVVYVDDPNWVAPSSRLEKPLSSNWADDEDDTEECPHKIKKELSPLLILDSYEYDEAQRAHLQTTETRGTVSLSPAFITPGLDSNYDDRSLYVTEIPDKDLDFLYAIFSRYARYSNPQHSDTHYPKVTIRESRNNLLYATVIYEDAYDAHFALCMLQKIRANYKGKDIQMHVRHAKKQNRLCRE